MATELKDPNDDGILEFTQTVEDVDGDTLSISLELDKINGTPQSGSDRDPSWLSFTKSSSIQPDGSRVVDVNVEVDASELGGAGSSYEFNLKADDGIATSTCNFRLDVQSPATFDGSEFWIGEGGTSTVRSYSLGSNFTFGNENQISQNSIGIATSSAYGYMKPDGKKLWTLYDDNDPDMSVVEFSNSWDVNSNINSQDLNNVDVPASESSTNITGFWWKPDGTAIYFLESQEESFGEDPFLKILEMNPSVNWSLRDGFDNTTQHDLLPLVNTIEIRAAGLFYRNDGKKFYLVSLHNNGIYEFNLGTAWDHTTASFVQKNASFDGIGRAGIWFSNDGKKLFTVFFDNKQVIRVHNLSTAWDISTVSFDRQISGLPDIGFFIFGVGV